MTKTASFVIAFGLFVGLLTACGGGGNGGAGERNPGPVPMPPVVDVKPGGIFHGTVTGCSTVCPVDTIMLVAEDGEWIGMDPIYAGGANVGQLTMNGSSFANPRRLYGGVPGEYGFRPTQPALIDSPDDFRAFEGDVVERVSIQGSLVHGASRNTKLAVSYDQVYENDSSLAIIAGTYSVSDATGYTLTYTIDSTGVLSGSDTEGCTASGAVAIIDSNFNMYRFNVVFTGCGANGAQGPFAGIGALLDSGLGANALLFYAVADNHSELVILKLPKL